MGKKENIAQQSYEEMLNSNPALSFITSPVEHYPQPGYKPQQAQTTEESIPDGYKIDPMYIEKKTRRVQLLLQPSVYNKIKANADAEGLSFNDYINTLLSKVAEDQHE